MDRKLLDILCCPTSRQPLTLLDDRDLATINEGIGSGAIRRADGSPQSGARTSGLITRVLPDWHLVPEKPLSALWVKDRHASPKVQVFVEFLATLFPNQGRIPRRN